MSRNHIEKVTCPGCGKEADFTVWDSVNTTLEPDLKEKVLTGDLFKFTPRLIEAIREIKAAK